jgi:hypothetical protein
VTADPFTLLVHDLGARLLDAAGAMVAERPWAGAADLVRLLPPRTPVQLVLAGPRVRVVCAEVPPLPARERREAAARLVREAGFEPGPDWMETLDPDPRAEGGHVLWAAGAPRDLQEPWLAALAQAQVRPLAALPWQRALLAAGPAEPAGRLCLALEPGAAHLLFFRGRGLRFTRTFALPPELDLADPDPATLGELARMAGEELTILLQFLRQKHKGEPPAALGVVGLPEPGVAALAGLGLPVTGLGPDLGAFLAQGADRERQRRGGLDLLPAEVRHAMRIRTFRTVVRVAVAGLVVLGAAAKLTLDRQVRDLEQEARQAEAAAQVRRTLARDGAEAARLRFGLLRLRRAEERQRKAVELLERLGVRLLQAPAGVVLGKVEVRQEPGHDLALRFAVEGRVRTGRRFSLGILAEYYRHLRDVRGLRLEPLKEIAVADGEADSGPGPELAMARFRIGGVLQ